MNPTMATRWPVPRLHGLLEIWPLSINQYLRMKATGILGKDDAVELLEGYIVSKDQGEGFAWPGDSIPEDVPRYGGFAPLWPLSLDQYHRMIQEGIIGEDDRAELIGGYLVTKDQGRGPGMGHGPPHATAVRRTYRLLQGTLGSGWMVQCQLPVMLGSSRLSASGEPEPDVTVAEGPDERYDDHHPGPQEIRLLTEVADSSLAADRNAKGLLYASAGIPLYWIINLVDRQLEVYSDPDAAAGHYRSRQIFAEDQQVVLSWPGLAPVTIQVRDLLPQ